MREIDTRKANGKKTHFRCGKWYVSQTAQPHELVAWADGNANAPEQ